MTQRLCTYFVTFCDGLTFPVRAANKRGARDRARDAYTACRGHGKWAAIVDIERQSAKGPRTTPCLYTVRLAYGRIQSGLKVLAIDACAAIAAARYFLACEWPHIPDLLDDTIVMHVANLGAHYDASIIGYTG